MSNLNNNQFKGPMNTFKIPKAGYHFLYDHHQRFSDDASNSGMEPLHWKETLGEHIEKVDKTNYHVNMTDDQASWLHSDAEDYASGGMVDDADRDLIRSAKSVHKAMGRYFE